MNNHAKWLTSELNKLIKDAADRVINGEEPAEIDKAGAEQRAFMKVLYMVQRMESQAPSIRATFNEAGKPYKVIEAESVSIRRDKDGEAFALITDWRPNKTSLHRIRQGDELTIETNVIIDRYNLD